jgi:hypothetical protein
MTVATAGESEGVWVVSGCPSDWELAVVTAVLLSALAERAAAAPPRPVPAAARRRDFNWSRRRRSPLERVVMR